MYVINVVVMGDQLFDKSNSSYTLIEVKFGYWQPLAVGCLSPLQSMMLSPIANSLDPLRFEITECTCCSSSVMLTYIVKIVKN